MVNSFYDKVKADKAIGFIFNDVAKVNWEKHLPVMYNFWENVLFFTGAYSGNPMIAHEKVHQQVNFTAAHFEEWLKLFYIQSMNYLKAIRQSLPNSVR